MSAAIVLKAVATLVPDEARISLANGPFLHLPPTAATVRAGYKLAVAVEFAHKVKALAN